ncbi:uncharacterized protein [Nicotiana tomentosiformis]|uniref:uncharacterized protein n=1 Tax=Nicotiana tomentosiformis TaxID=4098 RepID=UPI00388C36C4
MPTLPFSQKFYREKLDKQFERFLDMLKQVNVNLPFTEVLSQISAYAKFLKEILTKKKKIEETSVLADQTTIIREGMMENIIVRLDTFVFPIDFIVVNMEENKKVPLILGRPFLATGRAILDMHDIKLMLKVGEEMVTFEMNVATGVKKEKQLQVLSIE